jgi:selenide,water dikinase
LAQVLRRLENLSPVRHPDLLVGIEGSDDAAVYRLSDDLALVQSVDFFTPIVDDPYAWGRIAAANALSDIYAMGAAPLTALQLVGWPRDDLSFDLLGDVMEGGVSVLEEAGCLLVGGHSIDDREPKYGFAVTGVARPDEITPNRGGKPGDVLVLTKPIGTGLIATGIKRQEISVEVRDLMIEVMARLNDGAARAVRAVGASAVTDVTGFGLLGHLGEMLGEEVGAIIDPSAVPLLEGAQEMAEAGIVPGGTKRNLEHAESFTDFGATPDAIRLLLADAQTSGGLLIAVVEENAGSLQAALTGEATPAAAVIGRLVAEHPGRIVVLPRS